MTSAFRVLWRRSWAPFSWGLAGVMRWWVMPSWSHQTLSRLRPWIPVEAKGAPLSLRMASGRPQVWNRCRQRDEVCWGLVRAGAGRAAAVQESPRPFVAEAIAPGVAARTADAIAESA